jgi:hypothetical protein
MTARRVLMRVLAIATTGHFPATLDGNDRNHMDRRRASGWHRYGSPSSATRPARAGAGKRSHSPWIPETPISLVPSNCSASPDGRPRRIPLAGNGVGRLPLRHRHICCHPCPPVLVRHELAWPYGPCPRQPGRRPGQGAPDHHPQSAADRACRRSVAARWRDGTDRAHRTSHPVRRVALARAERTPVMMTPIATAVRGGA